MLNPLDISWHHYLRQPSWPLQVCNPWPLLQSNPWRHPSRSRPASTPAACPREPAQLHKVSGQLFPKQDSSVGARTQGPRVDIEEEQADGGREPHSRKAALAGVHQHKLTDVQGAAFSSDCHLPTDLSPNSSVPTSVKAKPLLFSICISADRKIHSIKLQWKGVGNWQGPRATNTRVGFRYNTEIFYQEIRLNVTAF